MFVYGVSFFTNSVTSGCCLPEECKITEEKLNLRDSRFRRVKKNYNALRLKECNFTMTITTDKLIFNNEMLRELRIKPWISLRCN